MAETAEEQIERRLADLEASAEAARMVLSLLIETLPDADRAALAKALEPLSRKVKAEAPRPGEEWPDRGTRALYRAVGWIEEALAGEDLTEV